jgi:hypothetical protein
MKANLERGLHFVRSLVAANVEEFRLYITSIASLLLEGALSTKGTLLVGGGGFETYLVCCLVAESILRTDPIM